MQNTSWKTTVMGLIAAVAGFIELSPELFSGYPMLVAIAKYVMIGGLAGLGVVGRDNKVSDEQASAGVTEKKP